MSPTRSPTSSLSREALLDRLRTRETEIDSAIRTRILQLDGASGPRDQIYLEGLFSAAAAALDYCLAGLERGEERAPPVPVALLAQSRRAAQLDLDLDLVIRRCVAGQAIIAQFLVAECNAEVNLEPVILPEMHAILTSVFDKLVDEVAAEYRREAATGIPSPDRDRLHQIKALLAGRPELAGALAYPMDGHHLGLAISGGDAADAVLILARELDRRSLVVHPRTLESWVWLGGRRPFEPVEVRQLLRHAWPAKTSVAVGEPALGLVGWRSTHRQAVAALPIAQIGPGTVTRYGDVALLASMLQDELLVSSLREIYLTPLSGGREDGTAARETLRAYFAANCQTSSAAASLGVDRHTVTKRLRTIQENLGRPLEDCAVQLRAALWVDEVLQRDSRPL